MKDFNISHRASSEFKPTKERH